MQTEFVVLVTGRKHPECKERTLVKRGTILRPSGTPAIFRDKALEIGMARIFHLKSTVYKGIAMDRPATLQAFLVKLVVHHYLAAAESYASRRRVSSPVNTPQSKSCGSFR